MNLKIANRLIELRKAHGLSQEALADKLGVSRQAVSKWERVEAAPDTDNLIALARLYGISLDELLDYIPENAANDGVFCEDDGNQNSDQTEKAGFDAEDGIHLDDHGKKVHIGPSGIFVKDGKKDVNISWKGIKIKVDEATNGSNGNGEYDGNYNYNYNYDYSGHNSDKKPEKPLKDLILDGGSFCLATIAFIIIGSLTDAWHPAWLIYFAVPILPALFKPNTLDATLPIIISGAYLLIGFLWGLWHPWWVLFLLIPAYYIVKDIIKRAIADSKK